MVVVQRRNTETSSITLAAGNDGVAVAGQFSVSPEAPPPPAPITTAASPTTSTTAPTATTRTTKTTKPPTTTIKAPRPTPATTTDWGPRYPGSVNVASHPGQAVWTATSNGIAMTLSIDPVNPVAGAPVHVVLEGVPPAGLACCEFHLLPGDATPFSAATSPPTPAGCAHPTTGPQRVETSVTFNHGGIEEFLFEVTTLCVNPDVVGVVYGSMSVGAGRSTAQGPSLPVVRADDGRTAAQRFDPFLAVAWADARDEDGYIAGFSVDWGDGTPVQAFPGDPIACVQTPSGWPRASDTLITGNPYLPLPSHRYADPQSHVVTVSAWSTGCDGSEVQRASATFPWVGPVPSSG